MMTRTSRAQAARSIAPPTSGPRLGTRMSQLARSPFAATSNAPRIVTSICPPRIIANDHEESTIEAPGRKVMRRLPASTRSVSALSFSASGPTPITPFSDWRVTSTSGGR